jgi:hypothetical protein
MNTVTIPKKLAEKGDLVVISREEYEALHEASIRLSPRLARLIRDGIDSGSAGKLTKARLGRLVRTGISRAGKRS